MTREQEIKVQLARLREYLDRMIFVHSYGGVVIHPECRPDHSIERGATLRGLMAAKARRK